MIEQDVINVLKERIALIVCNTNLDALAKTFDGASDKIFKEFIKDLEKDEHNA